MGLLRNTRDRFLPASNRTTVERSDQQLRELAALRSQLDDTRHLVEQLKRELASAQREQLFEQRRMTCLAECSQVAAHAQRVGEKAVLLAGWYGAGNTGDDLMMETMLSFAPAEIRRNVWVLMAAGTSYDVGRIYSCGAHVIHYPATPHDVDALAQVFDAVVWGGGAIIDDRQYNEDTRNVSTGNLFIRLSEAMLAAGKAVFACGVSSGNDLTTAEYAAHLQGVVDGSTWFSLRDGYSGDALRQLGVESARISATEDIVFANKELRALAYDAPDHTVIGMLPFYVPEFHKVNRAVLDGILASISDDESAEIRLIPFYRDADPAYLTKLRDACAQPQRVTIAPFATKLSDTALLSCSHVVTSRYHAALIAACLSIPFTCLVPDTHRHYPNKMRHLSDRLAHGYRRHFFDASRVAESSQMLDEFVADVRTDETPELIDPLSEQIGSELQQVWKAVGQI